MLVSVGLFVSILIFNHSYTFEFLVELIRDMKLSLWGLWASFVSSFESLFFFGNGIGTSNYILPQLNELAQFSQVHSFRGINLERFIVEFGILGLISLSLFLYFSFKTDISFLEKAKNISSIRLYFSSSNCREICFFERSNKYWFSFVCYGAFLFHL